MLKHKISVIIITFSIAAAFTACNNSDIDPEYPEAPETVCDHELVHVDGVAPTFYTNGCIEHYICKNCQTTFRDAEGLKPVSNVILWAKGYSRWQDNYYEYFISDEYQDFDEAMEMVQGQLNNHANFDLGSFLLTRLLTKVFTEVEGQISLYLDENGGIPPYILEVLDKLSSIESQLDQMLRMMKEQTYREALDARNQDILAAFNETNAKFISILKIAGNKKLSELDEAQRNSILHMLDQWYDHGFLGGTGIGSTKSLLGRYVSRYSAGGKSYPEIYDEFAYMTYPWEHQGYDFRIACRLVDQMVIAEVYTMSCLYMWFHRDDMPEAQFELDEFYSLMQNYGKTLDDHKVARHDDQRICQVPGIAQNMKFDAVIRDLDLYRYIDSHRNQCWEGYNRGYNDFTSNIDRMLCETAGVSNTDEYVNIDIYKAIFNFYNRDGQKKTMKECFEAAGFQGLGQNCVFVPRSDREYWADGDRCNKYKSFEKNGPHKKNSQYWFGMQVLKADCNGTDCEKFATDITVDDKHQCYITNPGKESANHFYVLKIAK